MPFDSFRSRPTGERNFSGARAALEARAQRVEADQVFEEFQRGLRAAQAPVDAHNEQTRRYREQTMIDPAMADPALEEKFARTELVLEMQAEFNKLDIALSTLGGYGKNPLVVERVKPFAEKAQAGMMKRQQQAMQLAQRPAAPQQYAQAGNVATDAELDQIQAQSESELAGPGPFKDLSDDDLRRMSRRQDLDQSEADALEWEMNLRTDDGMEPGSGSGFENLTNDEIAEAFQSADDATKGRLAQEALWRLQKEGGGAAAPAESGQNLSNEELKALADESPTDSVLEELLMRGYNPETKKFDQAPGKANFNRFAKDFYLVPGDSYAAGEGAELSNEELKAVADESPTDSMLEELLMRGYNPETKKFDQPPGRENFNRFAEDFYLVPDEEGTIESEWSNPNRRPDSSRPGHVAPEPRDSMGRGERDPAYRREATSSRGKGKGKTGFEHMSDAELAKQGRKKMSAREEQAWNAEVERRYKGQGKVSK